MSLLRVALYTGTQETYPNLSLPSQSESRTPEPPAGLSLLMGSRVYEPGAQKKDFSHSGGNRDP